MEGNRDLDFRVARGNVEMLLLGCCKGTWFTLLSREDSFIPQAIHTLDGNLIPLTTQTVPIHYGNLI